MRPLILLTLGLAGALSLTSPLAVPARAATTPASCTATAPKCFPWQYSKVGFDATVVSVPNLDPAKAAYKGTLFSPPGLASGVTVPAIALLHGATGNERNLHYLARALANQGFIALTVSTTQNTGNNDAYIATQGAMVRYLFTRTDPAAAAAAVLSHVDPSQLGVGGHSEGARATSAIQDPTYGDPTAGGWGRKVKAIVALDNLTKNLAGDAGSGLLRPNCTGEEPTTGSKPIAPVVPALGLAEDTTSTNCRLPSQNPPGIKQDAFRTWVASHVTVAEAVLAGTSHFTFAQLNLGSDKPEDLRAVSDLATAWFDRFLRAGSSPLCMNADAGLSTTYTSGTYDAGGSPTTVTALPTCAFDPPSVPTT